MIKGKKVLAVIPARGGSKGIPRKNLRTILGKSLVELAGRAVMKLDIVDKIIVSTDDDEIMTHALDVGMAVPFRRPGDLSGDVVGDIAVIEHALRVMEELDQCWYDIVLMVQPTSPMRTPAQLHQIVDKLVEESLDSVWSVSETDLKFHPLKQLIISDGNLGFFDAEGKNIIARQQLGPTYYRNGVGYGLTRDCVLRQKSMIGIKAGSVVLTDPTVSIDTIEDLARAEKMMAKNSFWDFYSD